MQVLVCINEDLDEPRVSVHTNAPTDGILVVWTDSLQDAIVEPDTTFKYHSTPDLLKLIEATRRTLCRK